MKVLQAGRDLISEKGGDAYSVSKVWPSIIIANILRDTEGKSNLYYEVHDSLTSYHTTTFYKYITQPIKGDTHIHLMLELSGLWKVFGHPDIDMDSSVKSWIEKGSIAKPIKKEITNLILWSFRLEFSRQFYKQHKKWSVVQIGSLASKIKRNYQNNLWNEISIMPWQPEDFEHVVLGKNLDFDYHVDITDLLSDKSIIP